MFTRNGFKYIFLLTIYLDSVFPYNHSHIVIVAYKPKGINVNIPYEHSIQEVKFYGKLTGAVNNKANSLELNLNNFQRENDRLVAVDDNISLFEGVLAYTLTLTEDGVSTFSSSRKIVPVLYTPAAGSGSSPTFASLLEKPSNAEMYTMTGMAGIDTKIVAYTPTGFSLIIRSDKDIKKFHFWANKNKEVQDRKTAEIKLPVLERVDSTVWIATNENVALRVGDNLYCTIHLKAGDLEYRYTSVQFPIQSLASKPKKEVTTTQKPRTTLPTPTTTQKPRTILPTSISTTTKTLLPLSVPDKPETPTVIIKKPPPQIDCENHVVLNTKDVLIDFRTNSNIKDKIDASKLSYLKIDDCDVSYRIEETGELPSVLKIVVPK